MRVLAVVLCALMFICAAQAEPAASVTALVTAVSGKVEVDGGEVVAIGSSLLEGQRLHMGADASVTLLYASGQIVEYRGADQGWVKVARDNTRGGSSQRLGGNAAQTAGAIFESRSRGVNSGEMVYDELRGGGEGTPLAPRDEHVRAADVRFRWTGAPDGEYQFVLTPTAAGARPAVERRVRGTTFVVNTPLEPGRRYRWSASPVGAEPEVANFTTLSAADEAALSDGRASVEKAATGTSRSMMLGLLYKRYGLYHDAIVQLEALPQSRWQAQELAWLYYQVGDLARSKSLLEASRRP